MSTASFERHSLPGDLKIATSYMMWLGVVTLLLGAGALIFPMVSTLTIVYFVGGLLLAFGAISLGVSFSIAGAGPFFAGLLFSLLSIGTGIYMLFNPAAAAAALTIVVGVIFMVQGAYEMAFAIEFRHAPGWWGMLLSAIASIVLSLIIIAGWPQISLSVLGILFGVNFLSSGIGLIMVSQALKS